MSTKTTFKRVALVAVAALGLGVMTSVAPANAAAAASMSFDTTSVTVVGTGASGTALFKITVKDDSATPVGRTLSSDETITATIVGVPAGTGTAKTLAANGLWSQAQTAGVASTQAADLGAIALKDRTTRTGAFTASAEAFTNQSQTGEIGSAQTANQDSATTSTASVYLLGIQNTCGATTASIGCLAGNKSLDQGAYTIRVRLAKAGFVLQEQLITVKYVSAAADSGAAFTISQTGNLYKGVIDTVTATNAVTVAMTNGTTGGRVVLNNTLTVASPTLLAGTNVDLVNSTTGVVIDTTNPSAAGAQGLQLLDTGVNGEDGAWTTAASAQKSADLALQNGTYGFTTIYASTLDTVTAAAGATLRIRYGSTQATKALTFNNQPTATAAGTTAYVIASGMSVLNTSGTLVAQRSFVVPLVNKSVTYKLATGVADTPLTFTVGWSGNQAAVDVTPVSGTLGKQTVRTDATGVASITLTNANPTDGAVATITVTGFLNDTNAVAQTITWKKSVPTTVSVSPGDYTAALKSTNTLTVTVLDQFLAPMAGEVLKPSYGATTDANYVAAPALITTGANGSVAYTWTDAAATATVNTDTLTFTVVSDVTKASSPVTVTYSATAATVATFTSYYTHNEAATAGTTATTLVPSTGVYVSTSTKLLIDQNRNNSIALPALTNGATNDLVFYYIKANAASGIAAGVPVTITAPTGAFIVNPTTNLPSSSLTVVSDATGYFSFVGGSNKTGAISFTIKSGAVSTTVAQWVGNAVNGADGRYVTLTGPATGTANGEPNLYTGSVTDRHGNAVSGVSVTVNAGGASSLGGGSTAATYVTLADGKFTFTGTSFVSAGGAGTFTATATTPGDYDSIAGYVGTNVVDSTLTAGVKAASVSVVWAEGSSAAANSAQAAADAAAEATDAANAATDAANAAAEAADAATAAAQDAADAVAALATSVEGMVSALKKQITALTNLVIKIQKKVRA
jgi:trimeric autotransporter adhesin